MFSISSSLTSKVNQLAQVYAKVATADLQYHASNTHNWPSQVAEQVRVEYSDGHFYEEHYDFADSAIKELEYGTPSTPLSPAIRTYMMGK